MRDAVAAVREALTGRCSRCNHELPLPAKRSHHFEEREFRIVKAVIGVAVAVIPVAVVAYALCSESSSWPLIVAVGLVGVLLFVLQME